MIALSLGLGRDHASSLDRSISAAAGSHLTPAPSPVSTVSPSPAIPPDWATFLPDLLVATVTGLIVGGAILIAQLLIDRRTRRAQSQRFSLRVVQPLLYALQRPIYIESFTSLSKLPRKQAAALAIIESSAVDEWHETEPTSLTRSLIRYRAALRDLAYDSDNLEQAVERWQIVHAKEPRLREWATADFLGAPQQYLFEVFPDANERKRLTREMVSLRSHSLVKKHARDFRGARARVAKRQAALLEALIASVRESHPSGS